MMRVAQSVAAESGQLAARGTRVRDAHLSQSISSIAHSSGALLLRVLRDSVLLSGLSAQAWSELIPQAKFAGLWPQIAAQVQRSGIGDGVPSQVRRHLQSAQFVASAHEAKMRWEVD